MLPKELGFRQLGFEVSHFFDSVEQASSWHASAAALLEVTYKKPGHVAPYCPELCLERPNGQRTQYGARTAMLFTSRLSLAPNRR